MYYKYRILYRHPHSGDAGLVILTTENEIAVERARLEALGYVVTKVLRPIGVQPELPPLSSGSPQP